MESHPDCALCFHDAIRIDSDGRPHASGLTEVSAARLGIEDLLRENFISACAVMYRWGLVESLPDWWADTWIGDWPLHILHAQHGWIGHISGSMAAYRVHPEGLWSGRSTPSRSDEVVKVQRLLDGMLGFRFHEIIEQSMFAGKYYALAERCRGSSALGDTAERAQARHEAEYLLKHLRNRGEVSVLQAGVVAAQGFIPPLNPPIQVVKGFLRRRRRAV